MKKIQSLIIPAAGIGSRLQPLTHITTKEMLRLVDRPIYYYLLKEAHLAGISHVIFIIHKDVTMLKKFILSKEGMNLHSDFPKMKFTFIETTNRFGDGHAILQARKLIKKGEVFAVSMGDMIPIPGTSLLAELKTIYQETQTPVIGVERIDIRKADQYGIIAPKSKKGRLYHIKAIVEKPKPKDAPSSLSMSGKYILDSKIFDYIENLMKERSHNEVRLAYALDAYAQDHTLNAYECKTRYYDTGTKLDLLKTEIAFAAAHFDYGGVIKRYIKQLHTR